MNKTFKTEDIDRIEKSIKQGEKIKRIDRIFYQNINGTRKAGINYIFSQEELSEYTNCANNPIYFIEKYCGIKYDYQKNIINHYLNFNNPIFLSSRQMGTNTIFALLYLHYIMFNINKNICLYGYKLNQIKEIIVKFKEFYCKLPFFIKKGIINWNENQIEFENKCKISSFKFCGNFENCNILHIDDYSHLINEQANDILLYVKDKPIKFVITSRPNGANHFYDLIKNSELPIDHPEYNNFNTLRTYWYQVPNRDVDWKKNEIKIVGEGIFMQEYELKFIISNKLYNILY